MKVKNKEEIMKNYYEKEKNQKSLIEKDWAFQIAAMFDMEYFIDKNNFHINGYNINILLNAACEDESKIFGFKVKFSDYRKIGNTNYVCPYNITSEVKIGQDIMISKIFIKSISKDTESEFIPANVKAGEGRLHGVLSKNKMSFQYFLEKGKTD